VNAGTKRLAALVAGLLGAPAAVAQTSNVQLYGRANLGFDYYSATGSGVAGADREGRVRVFDNSSRVGLRGTEELGNGLKAIFQIESGVNIDNGSNTGQGGQTNANTGFWAGRDSFVGLDANWGRLTFGRQSIYWANGVNAQFSANYINTQIPWTDGIQLGRISGGGTTPSRVSNVVQYTSPTFAGINGTLSYSPNAQESVQGEGAGSEADGYIWGATLRGTWGPWYAQIDYAGTQGNTPTSGSPRVEGTSWKVGGSWGYMPGARIGLIWVRIESNAATGLTLGDKVNQQGWTINWEHTFGNFQVLAQYGWTGSLKSCDSDAAPGNLSCGDTKASGYMVGGRYILSKRTWLYAAWNMVDNKANNFADYTQSAITSTVGGPTPFGADPEIWAVGIFHAF
jgi:predicted porin